MTMSWDESQSWDQRQGDVPVDPAATASADPEVEALVEDIETTRIRMTGTVDEIGDRLDPANIVQDAKQTVRDATVGKVETMTDQASQTIDDARHTAQQAGGSVVETIRRNPIPAALVGVGVAWLWMHRAPAQMGWSGGDQWSASRSVPPSGYGMTGSYSGEPYGGRGYGVGTSPDRRAAGWDTSSGSTGGSGIGDRMSDVGDRASDVADQLGSRASDAADQARQTAGQLSWQAQDMASRTTAQAQDTLSGVVDSASRLIEQNPLAAGAAAIAVGAAIGLTLPPTRQERQVLGSTSTQLLDQVEGTATQSIRQMDQQSSGQQSGGQQSSDQ